MAQFRLCGEMDPMLEVSLDTGEEILAESGAMVTMDACLELKGKAQGGFMGSLKRAVLQGESLFQQHIYATKAGKVLLAPAIPGSIKLLDVGDKQYRLNDGAFLASDSTVNLETKTQSMSKALFAGSGGFCVMETSGTGKVAVSGFGSLYAMEVTPEKEVIVDNGHVIAWDRNLDYEVTVTTAASSGFFGKLLNSQTSGEGLVLRFKGSGTVYICSRNQGSFLGWIFMNNPNPEKN